MARTKPASEIQGQLIRESEKAVQVKLDNGDQVWIPRSIIPYLHKDGQGRVLLEVEEWWLDQNEIDY